MMASSGHRFIVVVDVFFQSLAILQALKSFPLRCRPLLLNAVLEIPVNLLRITNIWLVATIAPKVARYLENINLHKTLS